MEVMIGGDNGARRAIKSKEEAMMFCSCHVRLHLIPAAIDHLQSPSIYILCDNCFLFSSFFSFFFFSFSFSLFPGQAGLAVFGTI